MYVFLVIDFDLLIHMFISKRFQYFMQKEIIITIHIIQYCDIHKLFVVKISIMHAIICIYASLYCIY